MSETRITKASLAAGLCPLIPLPLVDELVKRAIMKRTLAEWTLAGGEKMDGHTLNVLTQDNGNCLLGCLLALIWWPIKKFFKTVLYFLTIKECLDWSADTQIRLSMVNLAIGRGLLPEHAEQLRKNMDAAIIAHSGSPVLRILKNQNVPPMDHSLPDFSDRLIDLLFRAGGGEASLKAYETSLSQLTTSSDGGS